MPEDAESRPCFGQPHAEILHRLQPLLHRQRPRPRPLHAERRLTPPVRSSSRAIGHRKTRPCACDMRHCLRPELQRHPIGDGNEIQHLPNRPNVGCFHHPPQTHIFASKSTYFFPNCASVPTIVGTILLNPICPVHVGCPPLRTQ